jgi:hypothetical protein
MTSPIPTPTSRSLLSAADVNGAYLELLSSHSSVFGPFLDSSAECGGWSAVLFDGGGHSALDCRHEQSTHSIGTQAGRDRMKRVYDASLMQGSYDTAAERRRPSAARCAHSVIRSMCA